jgi:crotonobetainyl-CoA:carnitine CoA-transferase CaiB-like acyl-CoA transferase
VPITHHARGDIRLIGQPVTLNRTPAAVVTPIPEAGEHTDEVLREAGYDQAAIDRLKADKIV